MVKKGDLIGRFERDEHISHSQFYIFIHLYRSTYYFICTLTWRKLSVSHHALFHAWTFFHTYKGAVLTVQPKSQVFFKTLLSGKNNSLKKLDIKQLLGPNDFFFLFMYICRLSILCEKAVYEIGTFESVSLYFCNIIMRIVCGIVPWNGYIYPFAKSLSDPFRLYNILLRISSIYTLYFSAHSSTLYSQLIFNTIVWVPNGRISLQSLSPIHLSKTEIRDFFLNNISFL